MVDIDSSAIQDFFSDLPDTVHIEPCPICGFLPRFTFFFDRFEFSRDFVGFLFCPDTEQFFPYLLAPSFRSAVEKWNALQIDAKKHKADGDHE